MIPDHFEPGTSPSAVQPHKIGVVLGQLDRVNVSALKFLIVHLNTLQGVFEFEILPTPKRSLLLSMLDGRAVFDREKARQRFDEFHREVAQAVEEIRLEALPSQMAVPTVLGDLVALTMGKFEDGYHTTGDAHVRVVALGHWKSGMAPPSILEFFVTILLRQSVAMISPTFRASGHIGTKGCLFDFTDDLADARFKTMQGYVCTDCRAALATDHRSRLVDTLMPILDTRRWLGLSSDPKTPAGVVANLGHDLFLTRGAEPTAYQRLLVSLRDDGVKEIIKIVALAVVTSLLIWIGLTKP